MKTLRRPGQQPAFDVTAGGAQKTKKFNQDLRYCQGSRIQIAASSSTPSTITLNSSGKFLLGISIMPVSGTLTTLADTQVTFTVNNNNLLLNVAANNLNPNFVSDMIFFPTPQPLFGNDSLNFTFTKNDANAVFINYNIFYIPRV